MFLFLQFALLLYTSFNTFTVCDAYVHIVAQNAKACHPTPYSHVSGSKIDWVKFNINQSCFAGTKIGVSPYDALPCLDHERLEGVMGTRPRRF